MPSLNVADYIRPCIESVLAQTLKDIEIICVDSGSTDGTAEILAEYASADPRVTLIRVDKRSYGHQMNTGLARARGEYIGIVETDDFIAPDMYERLYGLTDGGAIDVVKGNFYDYYEPESGPKYSSLNRERTNMPDESAVFNIRHEPHILRGHPSIWSGIYRRAFLSDKGIRFEEPPGAGWVDNPFFFETLCKADKIRWTPKGYYYYRRTNPGSSSNRIPDLTLPIRRMMDNLDVIDQTNYPDEDISAFLYGRAFSYLSTSLDDKAYATQEDIIRSKAREMMLRMNNHVISRDCILPDQYTYYKFLSPLRLLQPQSGKLLIYSWLPFDMPGGVGGRVADYCHDLIDELLRRRPDIQVYYLSSGWAYDLAQKDCYIRSTVNCFGERCRSFEIVNSPVPSPQRYLLNHPESALSSPVLRQTFESFFQIYGPFSAVHFHSLAGLSLDALNVKEQYPDTRFILTLHDYAPLCITGRCFQCQKEAHCPVGFTNQDCAACSAASDRADLLKTLLIHAKSGSSQRKTLPEAEWIEALGFDQLETPAGDAPYQSFADQSAAAINRHMDQVLAVSRHAQAVAAERGIQASKTAVLYSGSLMADFQIGQAIAQNGSDFQIAFLGKTAASIEDGLPFLMDCLDDMDDDAASRISLLLVAGDGIPEEQRERLKRFRSLEVVTSYRRQDLKRILKDVNLGIVPALWADPMPHAAIDMAALGVPVLASDCCGAAELCDSALFTFKAGDKGDLLSHLMHFIDHPDTLAEYWKHAKPLVTMEQHLHELEAVYGIPKAGDIRISLEDYSYMLQENDFLYMIDRHNTRNIQSLRSNVQQHVAFEQTASVRIGRFITWLPRKISGGIQCCKDHGLRHTIYRTWEHLTGRADSSGGPA